MEPAAQPHAEEAADLVAEKDHPEQRGQIAHAEDLPDDAGGQRHRREPQHAHDAGEQVDDRGRLRQQQQRRDGRRARRVDGAQPALLAPALAGGAGRQRAEDVEQADDRDRPGADRGRQPEVADPGREVHRDERHVEAADEEAGGQQRIAAVPERLAQGGRQRLFGRRRPAARGGRARQHEGQRRDQQRRPGEEQQRGLPPAGGDERLAERREDHLPRGPRRRPQAQGEGAALGTDHPGHGGQREGEGGERHPDAHQDAGRQVQRGGAVGDRHAPDAGRVDRRARRQHPRRPEPVAQAAGERQGQAPRQVLDRQGQRERLAAPAARRGHRLQEESEDRARAEAEHRDGAGRGHDQRRRPPARRGGEAARSGGGMVRQCGVQLISLRSARGTG